MSREWGIVPHWTGQQFFARLWHRLHAKRCIWFVSRERRSRVRWRVCSVCELTQYHISDVIEHLTKEAS